VRTSALHAAIFVRMAHATVMKAQGHERTNLSWSDLVVRRNDFEGLSF